MRYETFVNQRISVSNWFNVEIVEYLIESLSECQKAHCQDEGCQKYLFGTWLVKIILQIVAKTTIRFNKWLKQ